MQVTERDLMDAPADGYDRAVEVRGELPRLRNISEQMEPGEKRYIFVRTMNGTASMKVELTTVRLDPGFMRLKRNRALRDVLGYAEDREVVDVSAFFWVNALGGRGFEEDPALTAKLDAAGGKRRLRPWDEWWNVRRPEFLRSAELAQH